MTPAASHADRPSTAPTVTASRFGRLSALAPLGLDASSCLHLQKPWIGCTRCKEACPADCLALEDGTLELSAAACTGCGRCAAACPTHALSVEGFDLADRPVDGPVVDIACPKHPGSGALRVPCLGGLHLNDLLARLVCAPSQAIRLADDRFCAACPNGRKCDRPAARLAELARPVLRSSSGSDDRLSAGPTAPSLPDGNKPSGSAASTRPQEPAASRRAFFSGVGRAMSDRLVRRAGQVSALLDPARIDRSPRLAITSTRHQETRHLMYRLAQQAGTVPVQLALPRVAVSDACRLHGGCTRLCPTGALSMAGSADGRELRFEAAQCVDCGACESVCPESALRVEAAAWRPVEAPVVVLSRKAVAECPRCGDATPNPADDGLCEHCAKSAGLARAGLAMFGRSAALRPAETGPP